MSISLRLPVVMTLLAAAGCVSRPPTIAHVHLGHASTAVHDTPNRDGYLLVARARAQEAHAAAQQAADQSASLDQIKARIATAVAAVSSDENFGLKQSLVQAANHISYAATSDDASVNLRQAAPIFAQDISRIVERCELVSLLGQDVAASQSKKEAAALVEEISKLTRANLEGEDADQDGMTGATPAEYGVKQLRGAFDAMIARENPPYRTVDQRYLFNLVRLPSWHWMSDKLNRRGDIEGFK